MNPTLWILLLWLAFGLSHTVLSSVRVRPTLVRVLSERGFEGVYSLIALAVFVPLVWVYFAHKHTGALLWAVSVTPGVYWFVYVGMAIAFVLVVSGLMTPSPSATRAKPGEGPAQPRGIHFITRHALFMGFGLFGLLHLIPNGFASDIAFFAGFPIFAVIGCIHQDRRKLTLEPERYRAFYDATPLIPFTGRNTFRGLRELSPMAVLIGLALTWGVRHFHSAWFS